MSAPGKIFVAYPVIRAILRFARPYPWILPAMAMLGMVSALAEGLSIGLLIPLLEVILHHRENYSAATTVPLLNTILGYLLSYSQLEAVLLVGVGMLVLVLIKTVVTSLLAWLSASINGRIDNDIRKALFRQMLTEDYARLIERDQGRLVSAFETQAWRSMEAVLSLFDLAAATAGVAMIALLLLFVSWRLTLIVTVLGLGINWLTGRPLTQLVHRLGNDAIDAASSLSRHVLNVLNGMRVIRAFGRENHELAKFEDISTRTRGIYVRMNLAPRVVPALTEMIYVPVFVAAVVIAQFTAIDVPTLLAFLLLFYRLQPQIRASVQFYVFLVSSGGAVLELAALLDSGVGRAGRETGRRFSGLKDGIVLRDVSFDFHAGDAVRPALSGVSLELKARQMTAVVGMSGAGKTTLVNLLYRFFEPTAGTILVDSVPLMDIDVASWRAHLALAGQDAALIDGTIFENIAYGRADATPGMVAEAARKAAIHDFISTLPRGYDTSVGERGLKLSEGQRQRIGLARALLREPGILILDEATNALDGVTERVVQQTLDLLAHHATLIVIAHRLSTIRMADHVIVLKEGRLVEQGAPKDLLKRDSFFAELHAAQIELDASESS